MLLPLMGGIAPVSALTPAQQEAVPCPDEKLIRTNMVISCPPWVQAAWNPNGPASQRDASHSRGSEYPLHRIAAQERLQREYPCRANRARVGLAGRTA